MSQFLIDAAVGAVVGGTVTAISIYRDKIKEKLLHLKEKLNDKS